MRRALSLALLGILFPIYAHAAVTNLPTITVMADHSLSQVVTEIARNYSTSRHSVVNSSFLAQKIQQEQISEGAAADVLITSKEAWIEDLKLQGLIDIHSQFLLAKDKLVVIASIKSDVLPSKKFPELDIIKAGNGEPNFLIGNPEALMEGSYSKEAVRNLGLSNDMEEHTLYVKRLEQMFEMVEQQQAFGMCFYSTALGNKDVKIINTIPASTYKPIVYYAVVIAGDNMNEARNFLDYLRSADVSKIFRKYGFEVD